ncbi:MAG TPA: hypothetical protein VIV40_12545 [Kofleriaceae bacterium]
MRRLVVALSLAALQASTAHGDSNVTVTLNPQGHDLANQLGLSVPELVATAEAKIDELYRVSRIDELLRAFANTAAFSQRGLGADYDVDPSDVFVGASAAGVHGDVAIGTTNTLLGGSIINFTLLAGANLARWHHPRWTAFASGFYEATTIHGLEGHLLTLGAHAQYQLVKPTQPSRARWTGVAATTGIEYARWTIGTASSIESHFIAQGPEKYASIHMSSTGTLDVLTTTYSVPLEVTTGVRLIDVLSLYTGGGAVLTGGDSTITAQLDSLLSINADNLPVGNATITGSGQSGPSALTVHALAGAMIHTTHARVFLQGAFTPGELSVSLGLRMVP